MLASSTDESQVNLRSSTWSQECVNWCVSCSRASTRPLAARCSSGFKAEACITYGFHRIYMDSWWLMYKAHLHCTACMYPHIAVWFAKLCTHYTHSWPLACPLERPRQLAVPDQPAPRWNFFSRCSQFPWSFCSPLRESLTLKQNSSKYCHGTNLFGQPSLDFDPLPT